MIYEAKIQRVGRKNKQTQYLIHYHGWNKNWDEWVCTVFFWLPSDLIIYSGTNKIYIYWFLKMKCYSGFWFSVAIDHPSIIGPWLGSRRNCRAWGMFTSGCRGRGPSILNIKSKIWFLASTKSTTVPNPIIAHFKKCIFSTFKTFFFYVLFGVKLLGNWTKSRMTKHFHGFFLITFRVRS